MNATTDEMKYSIRSGQTTFNFLKSGDIFDITHEHTMINQLCGNVLDGSANNLFLRVHESSGIKVYPLLGTASASTVSFAEQQVKWEGNAHGIQYQVLFTLTDQSIWFWDVRIEGDGDRVDVIYGQDVGLASRAAIQSNEAYMSQYVDHVVFEDQEHGYVVCSRQNQPQSEGRFPYLQQGALTKTIGYSTDGYQFFGKSYKETDQPEALYKETLANEIYQYEFAYTALQSERIKLQGKAQFIFYGLAKADHQPAITEREYADEIRAAWSGVCEAESFQSVPKYSKKTNIGKPLQTLSISRDELELLFPDRHQEELEGEQLLSFFTETHEHVVLKEKERLVERSHGHIVMSGKHLTINESILTSTSYIYGLFNAQVVVGNTSMNKMLSNARNSLNVMKISGQRIYVKIEDQYRLLTMPSLYEMGFNYSRWYYKTADEMFIVTNFTTVDAPEIRLDVRAASGKAYSFYVTNQITMNDNEYVVPFRMERKGNTLTFNVHESSFPASVYPNLAYDMHLEGAELNVTDETALIEHAAPGSASLVVLDIRSVDRFGLIMQGRIHGDTILLTDREFGDEVEKHRAFYKELMNGFKLTQHEKVTDELARVNTIAWWYTHNMLIHYLVPHGLEQYGGAAWGTRDVSQGPIEYWMSMGKYDVVREIFKTVFAHQYENDGSWPQWFMFDNYFRIQAGESHGDVIVWMLKAMSDYLTATGDFSILEEQVPYTNRETFEPTAYTASIYDHLKKEIQYIKDHFLHDTFLSSYGDGDWDDTLQPHDPSLRTYMASSWTVALTYQAMNQLSQALTGHDEKEAEEIRQLAEGIAGDFNQYMLQTDVIPGFIYLEDPKHPEWIIHPTDTKTGIQYRLLPMTRSMIGELFTPEQAERHYQLIKEKLQCPDGVRLMNRPATYAGGVSTNFKRAEQAANFGREVGLQYVHAHIRFAEAMAKMGKRDEVWNALAIVNPINIKDVVPNAERRQSNAYFSSSDGKFNTRYEAQARFEELREGKVPVKGGWRIYSSGPGIYMNQLVSNCLGIRQHQGDLILDPVLPTHLDGLSLTFKYQGHDIQVNYHLNNVETIQVKINNQAVTAETASNRYRNGGVIIKKADIAPFLGQEKMVIDLML